MRGHTGDANSLCVPIQFSPFEKHLLALTSRVAELLIRPEKFILRREIP